jgi:hypothetical protein
MHWAVPLLSLVLARFGDRQGLVRRLDPVLLLPLSALDIEQPTLTAWIQVAVSRLPRNTRVIAMAEKCPDMATFECHQLHLHCGGHKRIDLMTETMWKRLDDMGVSHVLLLQLDSRVCRTIDASEFDKWSKYDYIGAPWAHLQRAVGNGGSSFRSVRCMRIWSRMARVQSCHAHPEDVFISTHPTSSCTIAPFAVANAFAIESIAHQRPAFSHVHRLDGSINPFSRHWLGTADNIRDMCPQRGRVVIDGQHNSVFTGGPEAIIQLACAFKAWLPDTYFYTHASQAIHKVYQKEYPASRSIAYTSLRKGDVYIIPEVFECPIALVQKGVRVYIWELAHRTERVAAQRARGCHYISHNFALSRPPPNGVGVPRSSVLRPYITPSIVNAARSGHGHTNEVLLDNDNPQEVVEATQAACALLKCTVIKVKGFERKQLPALYSRSKVVIDWCLVGSERMPIEAALYGTVLITSDCKCGDDRRDFPIPARNVLKRPHQIMGALRRVLEDYEKEKGDMLPLRQIYGGLNHATLERETMQWYRAIQH